MNDFFPGESKGGGVHWQFHIVICDQSPIYLQGVVAETTRCSKLFTCRKYISQPNLGRFCVTFALEKERSKGRFFSLWDKNVVECIGIHTAISVSPLDQNVFRGKQ